MVKFNVGIIGAGYWGKKIISEYSKLKNVNIAGVADLLPENLEYARDRLGVGSVTSDFGALLGNPEISAVNICTPNATHYDLCRRALEGGKHVLVEKPMTLDSREAKELIELAAKKNLALSVGHIFRFNNALAEMRRLIGQNFFGKLFLLDLSWLNMEPVFKDRDVLFDLAPHIFDIMNYLLDEWPREVMCTGEAHRRKELEETAIITAKFGKGVIGHARISWVVPQKTRKVMIIGEQRSAEVDAVGQEAIVYESGYTYNLGIERNNTIQDELLHFIESTGNPGIETKNSGFVGMKAVEMIEASKRSIREGRVIRL